ncbi:MAG: beta strand repeat-containing protein, partial [Candidatus Kapaibacterium sp.]
LATVTASRALVSDGTGVISASAVTATELGYLSGVTSAIQTQIDAKVPTTRTVSTTSPLSGGGALSSNLTLSIADAAADGTNKGAAAFTANDFNAASGVVSIDYTNGQAASASANGFLSSADWSTFNGKQSTTHNSGLVWIGSAGNVANATALSGDVTVANTGAVTIANSAVTTAKINDGAVTTAKIAAGAVTSTELGAAAVTTAKIAAGAVTSTELGTGAVTTAKIAAGAVTTTEIADGTIADGDVSASAGIAATKIGGGAVDNTEYSYLDGVTSAIQTQLNGKQSTTLTNGTVWIGNGSNVATAVTLSGDVTTTNAGVTSIGAAKVTNAMLAGSIAASKLVGTDIATVGTITAGTWNGTTIAVANGGTGATSASGAMTNLLPSQADNGG